MKKTTKALILDFWESWLTQRKSWIPTFTLIPILYFLGWLLAQPIGSFESIFRPDKLSIIGTIISFFMFLLLLPSWVKARWKDNPK